MHAFFFLTYSYLTYQCQSNCNAVQFLHTVTWLFTALTYHYMQLSYQIHIAPKNMSQVCFFLSRLRWNNTIICHLIQQGTMSEQCKNNCLKITLQCKCHRANERHEFNEKKERGPQFNSDFSHCRPAPLITRPPSPSQ